MRRLSREAKTALGIVAIHNLVQNQLLNEQGYVSGNLAVSTVLVGLGRSAGLPWSQMGLTPGDLTKGLRIGGWASAFTGAAALAGLAHPKMRLLLLDERAMAGSGREVLEQTLVRFPVGTALFEEVAFRGVLPALVRQTHGAGLAETVSATAFTLWHIIPATRALSGNPLGEDKTRRRRAEIVLQGSLIAGLSGLTFTWMRRSTGSLLAPWLAHTSFNVLSYLAGVTALRLVKTNR